MTMNTRQPLQPQKKKKKNCQEKKVNYEEER
jgi:hypothetical protein